MDYTATYSSSPRSRARLYRHLFLGKIRRHLPLWTALAALTAWLSAKYLNEDQQSGLLGLGTGIVYVILYDWITAYHRQLSSLNTPEGQQQGPAITLTISDLGILVVAPSHNRIVNWTHLNRIRITRQLVHLSRNRLLLFQLPREQLSPEVLDFIRQKISTSRKSTR
ncbi:MAG: hypothetical protein JWO82_4124 [Akkermansiaceae bacterium]|nr:hypothetical protein [Akkermansiaceae bacterium]